ncbi:unnamed protein product [Orchesella dallaii]|uniref:Uncharacterized protein n=1 Tax=Orchesella dallaii TaxID=48710 RepID=A0ABP1PVL2_9HEXA
METAGSENLTPKNLSESQSEINSLLLTKLDPVARIMLPQLQSIQFHVSKIDTVKTNQEILRAPTTRAQKSNIIIHGMSDNETESTARLKSDTEKLLSDICGRKINIDTSHRLGQYKPNNVQPVKGKLILQSERDLIMKNRDKLNPPKFIKEDLPFSTRRDNAVLWNL